MIATLRPTSKPLRARQLLGKYRIVRRLGEGGFANVYEAMDTIEGHRVALKIPHAHLVTPEVLEAFKKEVRLTNRLDHENILPIKDASIIEGRFVIAMPLAEKTLEERLHRRLSLPTILDYAEQMLEAVAYAHRQRVVHCDIKPDNVLLFPDGRLKLTDFGIAKVAQGTLRGAGTGTVGFMAPEQAMGKPSSRSDVFSLGLVLYRMLSGSWPEWPFEWPPRGYHRLRGRVHPEMIALVKRAIDPDPRKRFRDAERMLAAFRPAARRALGHAARRRSAANTPTRRRGPTKRG